MPSLPYVTAQVQQHMHMLWTDVGLNIHNIFNMQISYQRQLDTAIELVAIQKCSHFKMY